MSNTKSMKPFETLTEDLSILQWQDSWFFCLSSQGETPGDVLRARTLKVENEWQA